MNLCIRWITALCLLSAGVEAEQADAAPPGERPHYHAGRAAQPVDVDGVLDEPAWAQALAVELAYETFPGKNLPAAARTEMLVTYDEDNLYVGFRARDPEPTAIRARIADRDTIAHDDFVGIIIDTFNDRRRGFEFFANPLGVQMDLVIDDLKGTEDVSWDAIWKSAGRITAEGYVVEMAIPFSSLRFAKATGEKTWGFDGTRIYPRGQRYRFQTQRTNFDLSCSVCQYSKITGFAGVSPGRNVELNPTLTSERTDVRAEPADPELAGGDVETEAGLTVTWGVTPNLAVNATLNPDFSQVETDVAQLDVNNPFALFFPENRPFFNEGADFFESPLNTVYTRVVVDPDWGVRLTGKQGRHAIGIFSAQDTVTNFLVPGSQRSRAIQIGEDNISTVVRYRADVWKRSNLGFLVTDREGEDYSNRMLSLDGVLRVTGGDAIRFQLMRSATRYLRQIVELGQPRSLEDEGIHLAYDHDTRLWQGRMTYEDIGDGFRADLGFIPRVGYRLIESRLERFFWGAEKTWWTRISTGGEWTLRQDQSGLDLERGLESWFEILGPRQSTLTLIHQRRNRSFAGQAFEESVHELQFSVRPSGKLRLRVNLRLADEIDFRSAPPQAGDQLRLEPLIELKLGRRLQATLRHTFDRLDVEGGKLFTVNLSDLRVTYQFNLKSFVRLITQFRDIDRDPTLFRGVEVDARSEQLFNQLLFSYKLNPRTVLFVGYQDNHLADDAVDLRQQDRTVFLKLGYAWVP